VVWALLNDLAQRFLTWNRQEQRAGVRALFSELAARPGAKVLDFGCGTGLFAPTIAAQGLDYVGYDIDRRLIQYARRLHAPLRFVQDKGEVTRHGPYDFVLANCCFHHIPDDVLDGEIAFIAESLAPGGRLVLIDILAADDTTSRLQRLYRLFERGEFVRGYHDYLRLTGSRFTIERAEMVKSHLFSLPHPVLHTTLGVYVGRPCMMLRNDGLGRRLEGAADAAD
jgi:SAM-dependent methyltransferase